MHVPTAQAGHHLPPGATRAGAAAGERALQSCALLYGLALAAGGAAYTYWHAGRAYVSYHATIRVSTGCCSVACMRTQCNGNSSGSVLAAWHSPQCRWGGLLCLSRVLSPVSLADVGCCFLQHLAAVQRRQLGVLCHSACRARHASDDAGCSGWVACRHGAASIWQQYMLAQQAARTVPRLCCRTCPEGAPCSFHLSRGKHRATLQPGSHAHAGRGRWPCPASWQEGHCAWWQHPAG